MLSEFQYMKYLEIQKSISFLAYLLIQALALNSWIWSREWKIHRPQY